MKTNLIVLVAFCCLTNCVLAQKADPVRKNVKMNVAAPSNQNNEIEAVYVDYTVDKKQYALVCNLWVPTDAATFNGGNVVEEDINFDGTLDLMVSLGTIDGFGNEVYAGFVWNVNTKQFDKVVNFSEIVNPEIKKDFQQIDSYRRQDNTMYYERWEWRFGSLGCTYKNEETVLVNDKKVEPIEILIDGENKYTIYPPTADEKMQNRAIVGDWQWVDDGELKSDMHLCLTIETDSRVIPYIDECTIYGSTAAFDLDCVYKDGKFIIFDKPNLDSDFSSLKAILKLNQRGDLTGNFTVRVGETTEKGTVTLRLKDE